MFPRITQPSFTVRLSTLIRQLRIRRPDIMRQGQRLHSEQASR
jgi:hypothetical protein